MKLCAADNFSGEYIYFSDVTILPVMYGRGALLKLKLRIFGRNEVNNIFQ
jgi:hypothetical protein